MNRSCNTPGHDTAAVVAKRRSQTITGAAVAFAIGLTVAGAMALQFGTLTAAEDAAVKANVTAGKKTKMVRKTFTFQQGVNGYTGCFDSEIWALAPTTILADNPNASSDANNDGGESQVLMAFADIIGSNAKQIPPNAHVVTARLLVNAFDQGNTVNLHRMLVPFESGATWSSVVDGVSADGFEASRQKDSFTFGKIAASVSYVTFDVKDTVQAWVNGDANYGWAFLNTGGDGWDFYTAESEVSSQRPLLEVVVEVPEVQVAVNTES